MSAHSAKQHSPNCSQALVQEHFSLLSTSSHPQESPERCSLQQQGEVPLIHALVAVPTFSVTATTPKQVLAPWDAEGRQAANSQALQTVSIPPLDPTVTHKCGSPKDAMGIMQQGSSCSH